MLENTQNTEFKSYLPVSKAHTVVNVRAMMIKLSNTSIANPAMFGSEGSDHPT